MARSCENAVMNLPAFIKCRGISTLVENLSDSEEGL
jgi:hypothetical protein